MIFGNVNWRIWANGARETLAGAFGHEAFGHGAVKLGPIIAKKKKKKKKKRSVFPAEFLLHIPTPHQILIIFHFGILQKKIFLVVFFPGCLQRPKNGIIPKLL